MDKYELAYYHLTGQLKVIASTGARNALPTTSIAYLIQDAVKNTINGHNLPDTLNWDWINSSVNNSKEIN